MISIAELKKIFDSTDINILEYLRKSRSDGESETIEDVLNRHENILRDFMKKTFNYVVPQENIYREVVSGETIDERVEIQKAFKRIEEGKIFAIVVVEPQRLSRGDKVDIGTVERTLLYTNTIVITPTKIYDLNDQYDRKIFLMELEQGSEYLEYTKTILNRGRMRSIEEGKYINSRPPLGYDKVKIPKEKGYTLKPNNDAHIIKELFETYIETGSVCKAAYVISDYLDKPVDMRWTKQLLSKKIYAGYITWGNIRDVKTVVNGKIATTRKKSDNPIETKGLHEPIISLELFEKAQLLLAQSKPRNKKELELKNPLAGLLYCGKCGSPMWRRTNQRQEFLTCYNWRKCDNKQSSLSIIEQRVFESIAEELKKENKILEDYQKDIVVKTKDNTRIIAKLKKQIEVLDKKYDKICEFYELGDYTRDLFLQRKNNVLTEKESLISQIKSLEVGMQNNEVEIIKKRIPLLEKCLTDYNTLSVEEKNSLLKTIIKDIKYVKLVSGSRWHPENIDNFTLEITFLS